MFDVLIKELEYELENIRKSFFKKWIILSIIYSIGFSSFPFINLFIAFYSKDDRLLFFIFFTFIFFISSLIVFSSMFSYRMSKKFSFITKEKIFSIIKKLGYNIEIINYQQKSRDLMHVAVKIYQNFHKYYQEDNFIIRVNRKDIIKICEIELTRGEGRRAYTIFTGIVISIPTAYVKNKIEEYTIVKEDNYTHIFIPQEKDLFELSILKPIKQEHIENIIKQLKDCIDIASKFIKEDI